MRRTGSGTVNVERKPDRNDIKGRKNHKSGNVQESPLVSNRITRILFADAKTVTFML